ncbi:MAG: NADH-quinone oxidoreductase subunit NuoG [Nitrospirota bacterium]|nr:NADH-quinone oxidoreductase subunit NuoG [Nitrospirota bacterium]
MVTIFIDNKPHQVKPDQNLLQACLSLGFDLPYFCWHPALHAVGACRQCAVKQYKDDKDAKGRIIMSCMTPVSEGLRISVDDPEARAFRKGIVEQLMLNHPHDCPVCDEGGECHLQDMTVMTGHNYRRSRFRKRTHQNQDLGPFLNHEMNRCIQCYRCVRFYRGVAGGRDLNVFGAHDHVYFGRHADGPLESEFSGNLIEICPTGVFTDKTLKEHYTRKWDLQTAPSICVHCGVGCNTIAGERYGSLRRIMNRYNRDINGYFLCDRGRFGYEFVNSHKRIRTPLVKSPSPPAGEGRGEGGKPADRETVLTHIADILSKAKGVIAIGSPRASLESNFALRTLAGENSFFSGIGNEEQSLVSLIIDIQKNSPASSPSLREIQAADAVLILGEDLPNTAPLMALAVRQASRNKQFEIAAAMKLPLWDDNAVRNAGQSAKSPVYIISPAETRLDDVAAKTAHVPIQDIVRLASAISQKLDPNIPPLSSGERTEVRGQDVDALAKEIATVLMNAKHPLIVSGTGCQSTGVVQTAANIARALQLKGKAVQLAFAVHECNTLGAALLGGRTLDEAFTVMQDGLADTVIILENDLYRRADEASVEQFLGRAKNIIVLDHIMHRTADQADVVLPAATFAESSGTLINYETRPQRYNEVFVPRGDIQAGWKWINAIMMATQHPAPGGFATLDDIIRKMSRELPLFAELADLVPPAGFRIAGQKVPRQSHRYSGRTSMIADRTVHEPKPAYDADSPLAFSMEGSEQQPPAPLISRYWSPGWNSVQALNRFQQEVGGDLRKESTGTRLIKMIGGQSEYFRIDLSEDPAESPQYFIFGSEELSNLSPALGKRRPMDDQQDPRMTM